MKDIATASGVSTATVSYVVNNGPKSVLPETRDRILNVMDRLGYRPNAAARGLMGKRTHTFGVVLPHGGIDPVENQYFSAVLGGILDVASERKQVTMLFTGMSWLEVTQNVPLFFDGRCDGFIFLAPPAGSKFLVELAEKKKKFVLLGTRAWGLPVSTVDCENIQGSRLLTRHLIELGHQRIGMITGDAISTSSPERLKGYREEMDANGIKISESWIQVGEYSPAGSEIAARDILARRKALGLTAIICAHDSIAEILYRVAAERGVCIPDDLSVVGFDDLPLAASMEPPLTTVRQPLRSIGASAARILLDYIESDTSEPVERLFDVALVPRGSCGAPKTEH